MLIERNPISRNRYARRIGIRAEPLVSSTNTRLWCGELSNDSFPFSTHPPPPFHILPELIEEKKIKSSALIGDRWREKRGISRD